jgi:predicted aspartyl protease
MSDMGTFRIDIEVESPVTTARRRLPSVLVDTGAELSWIPSAILDDLGIERRKVWHFRQGDGTVLERWAGFVILRVGGIVTNDEVVFGEPGDLVLLGSRSLEGLNVRVDPVAKRLVDAGPAPAAQSSLATLGMPITG